MKRERKKKGKINPKFWWPLTWAASGTNVIRQVSSSALQSLLFGASAPCTTSSLVFALHRERGWGRQGPQGREGMVSYLATHFPCLAGLISSHSRSRFEEEKVVRNMYDYHARGLIVATSGAGNDAGWILMTDPKLFAAWK